MTAFTPSRFVKEKVAELQKAVKDRKVLVAVSGGVDSMTCAFLAHRAAGSNLVPLFLDNGLMRLNEGRDLAAFFAEKKIELQVWDVQRAFFDELKGKTDPEDKRKAFRDVFYRTLGQALRSYSAEFLVQGTIAADIIETQKGIKTQHNVLSQVGINPAFFGLKVLEPLKALYKDQVRKAAKAMGLPNKVSLRRPFPGPGLSARVIGEATPERVEKIRIATAIVEEELTAPSIFQVFPVLLSDKATGIGDDKRLLGDIIAVRAVESKNALTAKPCRLPWAKLDRIRERIMKKLPDVVKVVYDITPKPPSTIEYV